MKVLHALVGVALAGCGVSSVDPAAQQQAALLPPTSLVTTTCGGRQTEYSSQQPLSIAAHAIAAEFPSFQSAQDSTSPKFIDAHPSPVGALGAHAELEGFGVTMVQSLDWNSPIDHVSGALDDPGLLFFQKKNSGSQTTWNIIGAGYFFNFACAKPSMSNIPSSKWLIHEAGYHLTGSSGGFTCATDGNLKSSAISAGVSIDAPGCIDVADEDLKLHFGDVKHGRIWTVHVWFDPSNGNAVIAPTDPWCRQSTSALTVGSCAFRSQGTCTCG